MRHDVSRDAGRAKRLHHGSIIHPMIVEIMQIDSTWEYVIVCKSLNKDVSPVPRFKPPKAMERPPVIVSLNYAVVPNMFPRTYLRAGIFTWRDSLPCGSYVH